MSVLIRGMEMPKNCKECPFSDHEAWCLLPGDWRERYYCPDDERSDDCPLIEIPTPHGRLIDADKLEEGFKRAIGTYLPKDPTRHMDIVNGSECRGWTYALMAVQEAKTVIEAED